MSLLIYNFHNDNNDNNNNDDNNDNNSNNNNNNNINVNSNIEPHFNELSLPWPGLSLILSFDDCSQIPVRDYQNTEISRHLLNIY